MKKIVILSALALALATSGCTKKRQDLKSPCVGAKGSPCDTHKVNDWWLS